MKTNKILFWITAALIILTGGIYGGLKEWTGASQEISETSSELTNVNLSDLMASMNINQLAEPLEAPDFELTSLEGVKHRLSQYRGKAVILSFWATW
jgi:cytochrome oxidase Cu insertion factor (SCO1/SenC/PrrC family)